MQSRFGIYARNWQGGQIKRNCLICSKEFYVDKHVVKKGNGKYCSISCASKDPKRHRKLVERLPKFCVICGKTTLYRLTDVLRESNRGRTCSIKCRIKYNQKSISGNKNYRWKNGKTKLNALQRSQMATRNWSRAIKIRDNFTCQDCGIRSHKGLGYSVKLHSHHIKSWSKFPKLKYDLKNGITLCNSCHKKRHTLEKR